MNSHAYPWQFFRAGGFDQVLLETGAELARLDELDQKLWVALACPTEGLEADPRTLALLDADADKRIRAPELLAAVKWAVALLQDPEVLVKGEKGLPLAAIRTDTEDGRRILASVKWILAGLGRANADHITVADTVDREKVLSSSFLNGDGILPPESVEEVPLQEAIRDILSCMGGQTDRSGKTGVGLAEVDAFFAEAQACSDWWKRADLEPGLMPLGEATGGAYELLQALRAKVDDYFGRCRLVAFDPRAGSQVNRAEAEYGPIAGQLLGAGVDQVADFPLALADAGRPLPLTEGINPAWAARMARLKAEVVAPILGPRDQLSEAEWGKVLERFSSYAAWKGAHAGWKVEKLGLARVRDLLASGAQQVLQELLARDEALAGQFSAFGEVEKLVRYQRDLFKILNNFVSFRGFYSRREKAMFQAGVLYLDQRSCELCLKVTDVGKHAALATLARTYLAYCECTRKSTGEVMTIAAAFTDGDSEDLMVGRNGIFYDRKGQDWDATIVKLIEHPISIRQAFWSPYKTVGRMIAEQVEKLASAREKSVTASAGEGIESKAAAMAAPADPAAPAGATPAKPPFDVARFAGIFAAIGLALGALATAVASIVTGFLALPLWQMPLAIIGIILAISGPSMAIAALKLRNRSLGPLLDASGWAINAKAKVNIPFGSSLTSIARLPPGARRDLTDPFEEKKSGWRRVPYLLVLLGIVWGCWYVGLINKVLPGLPASSYMEKLEKEKAAAPAPAPAPAAPAPAAQ